MLHFDVVDFTFATQKMFEVDSSIVDSIKHAFAWKDDQEEKYSAETVAREAKDGLLHEWFDNFLSMLERETGSELESHTLVETHTSAATQTSGNEATNKKSIEDKMVPQPGGGKHQMTQGEANVGRHEY